MPRLALLLALLSSAAVSHAADLSIEVDGARGDGGSVKIALFDRADRFLKRPLHSATAAQAFEHEAFDYLLKPIRQERLARTVERLRAALSAPAPAPDAMAALQAMLRQLGAGAPAAPAAPAPLQWIRAAVGQETRLIAVEEVIYFQSNDKYTSVFLPDGESLIRTPLRQLKEQLDPQQFWQIHRGVIVAARHVAGTRTDFRGRLHVKLKGREEQLVVSRNYMDVFRQM